MRKVAFRATAPLVLVAAVACGGEVQSPIEAALVAPEAREAKITVTPALELSQFDEGLADRMVIEDIRLNLGDVRLLGADPRIPVGGLALLERQQVIEAFGDRAGIDLPFPSRYLDDEDLAVYVNIATTPELDGASVVVRARLYQEVVRGGSTSLTADTTSATDPDGDPARDPDDERVGATDPDGDPALPPNCDEATDPDGDPAQPDPDCTRRGLVQRGEYQPYVTVELRDDGAASLVATLSEGEATDVVVGIPGARWFTPEVLADLDAALQASVDDPVKGPDTAAGPRDTIIVQSGYVERSRDQLEGRPDQDYFLSDAENLERLTVKR